MQAWSLHVRERYDAGRCAEISDISPCTPLPAALQGGATGSGKSWLHSQLRWPAAAAGPRLTGGETFGGKPAASSLRRLIVYVFLVKLCGSIGSWLHFQLRWPAAAAGPRPTDNKQITS